ncbi:NADP-dependent oxidoreductase [Cryptosporangium aurantiacum]|uniref:NADPH:quinone reductase n=1 Tax=Cryptosporangium aurantiacum TaxID=134849 RepID=A0A1M7PPG2_9ACTN|nr:NADP-dependent oxidoreductase [Cryptosporangium aurantiacum]SHN19040.1 NADPH:quinone reductase [Cryptosporangium aurantiacum]
MRALVFDQYGPPDVLHIADAPEPHAGPGQVRIAVRAAGVNPVDWKIRSGASAAFHQIVFPHIPGFDAAGIVDEVGADVADVRVGDEVFGSTATGASAEYAVMAAYAHKPAELSWADAAALPSAVETGLRAVDLLAVSAGETLVVNGAAGGVGLSAAQFALARGAFVIGTASEANQGFVRSLGITPVPYGDGLADRVRTLARRVDRALDAAGHGALPDLIALTGEAARVITVADGPGAAVLGVRFTTGAERRYWEAFDLAVTLHDAGQFTLPVAQTFALPDAAEAHRRSESGHTRGKLVILLRSADPEMNTRSQNDG